MWDAVEKLEQDEAANATARWNRASSAMSGLIKIRIHGGSWTMTSLEKSATVPDCVNRKSDTEFRHEFLSAITRLPHVDVSQRRDLGLAHTIEAEIIPRLMLAHQGEYSSAKRVRKDGGLIERQDIEQFNRIICEAALSEARQFIATLRARDVSVETILLDLLAPTAKLLGEMWEADDVDFAEVTIALCCLQQVLRDVSGIFDAAKLAPKEGYRALLAPVPGEQHIFSVLMVDEFFRRADWDVWTMPAATEIELLDLVRRESFDMAGLSISCEAWLPQLKSLIACLRAASRNRELVVMVGGRPFVENPQLVSSVGADATAADGREAVKQANSVVGKAIKTRLKSSSDFGLST